jgi:hypothetical protein
VKPEQLRFDFIYDDLVAFSEIGGDASASLFNDQAPRSPYRVTNEPEVQIVTWILADERRRGLFFSKMTMASGLWEDSIPDREFSGSSCPKGGDIDFVMLEGNSPKHAICIEFKRVKVRIDSDGKERINHLPGLDELVKQGNLRQSHGFYKSFICGVAVIDSHEYRTPNVFTRGMQSTEIQRFYGLAGISGLHNDVGVLLIEISQPTGKHIDEMSGFGVCVVKQAGVLEQSPRLTEDLTRLFGKKLQAEA